jgi:hypothetical protein
MAEVPRVYKINKSRAAFGAAGIIKTKEVQDAENEAIKQQMLLNVKNYTVKVIGLEKKRTFDYFTKGIALFQDDF